jgi:hypothetical protein
MKFCPTCETRYDEEILRFCTKDGTPLVDEDQPNFTEMPSESLKAEEEDLGEETMVRYKPPKDILPAEPEAQPDIDRSEAPRIVISTTEQEKQQNVRARTIPPYQPPPEKQSIGKVVLLTILGTLAVIAVILGMFVFLRDEEPASSNLNINTNPPDTNLNTNLNVGASNFNFNANTNFNVNSSFNVNLNTNINSNLKTPTPKPSPSANINVNTNINTNVSNTAPPPTPRPSVTISPTTTQTPPASPTPTRTPASPSGRPSNNSSERH